MEGGKINHEDDFYQRLLGKARYILRGFKTGRTSFQPFKLDESVKSQNQTVLKKVQIQGVQILQS